MSTFTTRANFSIFSFWAANSVFSICTTLSFCCAERQSALRQHGLLSLIGRLLCSFLFQLGLLHRPRAFFLALTTAEPLTCHLRQQPHPLTVMRSRRAVMSLGLFTDSLHLRCSASQLVHEMRRPRNFQ